MMTNLDEYQLLECIMMKLDDHERYDVSDKISNILDNLWGNLTQEEITFLHSRGSFVEEINRTNHFNSLLCKIDSQ